MPFQQAARAPDGADADGKYNVIIAFYKYRPHRWEYLIRRRRWRYRDGRAFLRA